MRPILCIIISSYNGSTILYKNKPIIKICLDSLRKTTFKDYSVVVTDDCSPDKTDAYIRKNYPYVDVLSHGKNLGYAENNNSAMRYVLRKYNPRYILLLNDDIIVKDREWLGKMVEVMEKDSAIGVEGCKLLYPDLRIQHAGIYSKTLPFTRGRAEKDNGQYDKVEEIDAVIGAAFLLRSNMVKKIGVLDSNYYKGPDDVDYCLRASRAGYKVVYNGLASLIHLEGFTFTFSKSQEMRDKVFYNRQMSRTYFAYKNYTGMRRLKTLMTVFGGGIFTIEAGDRTRGLKNLKLNDRLLWRVGTTSAAMLAGKKMYSESIRMHQT